MNETVGRYIPETPGSEEVIRRAWFRQGMVYKNWEAYQNEPETVCYIPELSDSKYTAKDFLEICDGQKDLADELFDGCDWQHPETLMEDWLRNDEWKICGKCERLFNAYGDDGKQRKACPFCGKEVEE